MCPGREQSFILFSRQLRMPHREIASTGEIEQRFRWN
jgi:hypothetical protein